MRVQAKRVQCNGKLKIKHKVNSFDLQQRDQLLAAANADKMKPVYCFYCTESQRSTWKQLNSTEVQTGCLLADANIVSDTTTNLKQIENKCIPWHYLFKRAGFARRECEIIIGDKPDLSYVSLLYMLGSSANDREWSTRWDFPSIEHLNGQGRGEFDRTGVVKTVEYLEWIRSIMDDGERLKQGSLGRHLEESMHRIMLIDVQEEPTAIT